MTINKILCAVVFGFFAFAGHTLGADIPVPPAGHRVTDQSKVLSAAETQRLADRLKVIQDTTGAQIYILTVPTVGDEGIAPFANRVFVAWGVGRKGVDNGLLIVLATTDRRVRVEVGRGLEGNIPDITARRITADTMGPLLKDGRYFDGLMAGVNALAMRIDSKVPAEAVGNQAATQAAPPVGTNPFKWVNGLLMALAFLPFIIFAVIFIALFQYAKRHGSTGGSGTGGYVSGDSSSSSSSDYSSSSSSNDSSGGGGDSAGGGSDSSY
jgi:uncharacterized protein